MTGNRDTSPASLLKAGVKVKIAEDLEARWVWLLEREARASAHVHRSLGRATVCSQPLRVRSQPSIRRKAWVTVGQQSQQSGEELAVDGEEDTEERVWTNELAGPFASVSPTSSHDGPQGTDFSLGLL